MSKVKTNSKLTEATKTKSDAGKAGFRPGSREAAQPLVLKGSRPEVDPWDGKKRLDAPTKSLRVAFTEIEIVERRIELEKRLAQTPHLRDQVSAASDALKAAKAKLTSHVADSESFSAITKQGWQYQDVECIEVLELRPGGHQLAVTYRTDTGEEVSKRDATTADVQDTIPGA